MKRKLCLIYNTAPRYREAIFRAIDREYDCDWYFGETKSDIKEMDLSLLRNTKYYKSYGNPSKMYWQGALIPCLFNRKYDTYFILTETRSLSFWTFMLLKSLFFHRKKVYGWSHGFYGRESNLVKKIERWRHKHMTGQFVYNERAKKLMMEAGIDGSKIHVIANSLDYDTQLALRKTISTTDIYENHFGNNNPVLLFIGRLTPIKRLDLLLKAAAELKHRGIVYNVALIGDGASRKDLEVLAEELEIKSQVWFYGACYDEKENAELVFNSTLCVSPGNVGLTAMHSLMFGTPVITNDDFNHQMPEFEAIKPGLTGDFFKNDDYRSLASAIERWIENHPNREEVREECYKEMDSKWNPHYQMKVIKSVIK